VGHDDGVGRERAAVAADRPLEMWRADLLLQFPEEVDVQGHVVVDGVLGAEEGGQRRTLVVGRAAPEIVVAAPRETERMAPPLRLAGGLHVEMVVDGDGREAAIALEAGMDERMATGRYDGRLPAERAHETRGRSRRATDVAGVRRIGGDARQLDQGTELALV